MTTRSTLGLNFLKFDNIGVTNCNIESTSNGIITLSSQSGNVIIRGVADPVNNQDAVTKSYVGSNYVSSILTNGNIYVGNNSNVATGVTMSGNATISNLGVITVTQSSNTTNTGITNDTATSSTVYPTWVTGTSGNLPQKISSTKMNFVPSSGSFTLTGGLSCSSITTSSNSYGLIRSTGVQTIINGTNTTLTDVYWGTSPEIVGTDLTYNNNGTWTVNQTGIYIISYSVSFATDSSFIRSASIYINGVAGIGYINCLPVASLRTGLSTSVAIKINATDVFLINVYVSASGNVNMDSVIRGSLSAYRIA